MGPCSSCTEALRLLALASLIFACLTTPEYYIRYDSATSGMPHPISIPGCLDHPSEAYGGHLPPISDLTGTTLVISAATQPDADTKGVICKGLLYQVQVSFPATSPRMALLTLSAGTLGDSSAYNNLFTKQADICAGKRLVVQPPFPPLQLTTFNTTAQVPCSSMDLTTTFEMTSSRGDADNYLHFSKTYTIQTCGACTEIPSAATLTPSPSPASDDSGKHGGGTEAETETRGGSDDGGTGTSSQGAPAATGGKVGGSGTKCKEATTGTCTPSVFGYSCQVAADKVTVHYAYGNCVPDNECTQAAAWTSGNGPPTEPLWHLAAEASTSGYVAVGFTKNRGLMPNTDAVLGYIDGTGKGQINVYPLTDTAIGAPYPDARSMLSYYSVVHKADGRTIICFARPLNSSTFKFSPTLDPAVLTLNHAHNERAALTTHTAAGGLTINVTSGATVISNGNDRANLIYIHGALMVIAWIALAPLGAILARHKWALGEKKLGGIHVWFHSHRLVQVTAVATATAAFVIALTKLDARETTLGYSHKYLGIIVMVLAYLQACAAVPRPAPTSPHRPKWNLLHHWLGRTTIAAGIATCYIGTVILHRQDLKPYFSWLVAMSVFLGALVLVEILLSVLKSRHVAKYPIDLAAGPMPDTPLGDRRTPPTFTPYGAV